MEISKGIRDKIVDFILKTQSDKRSLNSELNSIFFDSPLRHEFDSDGKGLRQFAEHVVDEAIRYGATGISATGQKVDHLAVVVMVRGLASTKGANRQKHAEELIAEITRLNPQ